jgi:PPE-repeat protein
LPPTRLIPTGFKAAAKGTGIELTWDRPSSPPGIRFNLYLTNENGKISKKLTAQPISDNFVLLEKMKTDRVHHFVLTAVNRADMESGPTKTLEASLSDLQKKTSEPAAESEPESTAGQKGEDQERNEKEASEPFWSGEAGYTFSSQAGQITQQITLTGNYYFKQDGHYLTAVAGGGQQILEGAPTSYGTFSTGGRPGFWFFSAFPCRGFRTGGTGLEFHRRHPDPEPPIL